MSGESPSKEGYYIYVARLASRELYFGRARCVKDRLEELNAGEGNPRIRGRGHLTLLRSWEVADMGTAASAICLLQNASLDLIEAALREADLGLGELMGRVLVDRTMTQCIRCGAVRPPFGSRDLCESCYRKEPSDRCKRCNQLRHHVSPSTGLCAKCAEIEARPVQECARCKKVKRIVDPSRSLCKECLKYLRLSAKRLRPPKVTCTICGMLRSAARKSRHICAACAEKERSIVGKCAGCGKLKQFRIKSRAL